MIGVVGGSGSAAAAALVDAALRRSITYAQSRIVVTSEVTDTQPDVIALVDADNEVADRIEHWRRAGPRKLIVFGPLPVELREAFGFVASGEAVGSADAESASAPVHEWRESRAAVVYNRRAALLGGKRWRRAFTRFDFTNEWNNLGFGAIRADGDMWSVGAAVTAPPGTGIADIVVEGRQAGTYAALIDAPELSLLWFNRPVGPIDSFEWRLVENFLSSHRGEDLPCLPVLSEIPWGYDFASTMRLDCDEDLASIAPLADGYADLGVPLSVAVLTRVLDQLSHREALTAFAKAGGAVLSHSATHAPFWGGTYEAALTEANASAEAIAAVTGQRPTYAVSPFHETPAYALEALREAGYRGCAGGRIGVEPAFVTARGGIPATLHPGFIGNTQQCMLHGDCLDADGGMAVYEEAVMRAWESATLFAYLDHPFSQRYQYGWASEEQRLAAHRRLIACIRRTARHPVFLDEDTALDFLRAKSLATVQESAGGMVVHVADPPPGNLELAAEYRGQTLRVVSGKPLL